MVVVRSRGVIILIAASILLNPGFSQSVSGAVACGSTISSNITLTSDLLGCPSNGLIFGANSISLDCQGHTLSGSNAASSIGIYSSGMTGLTIANCTVKNFDYSIYLSHSSFNHLTSNTVYGKTAGFRLDRAHNNTLVSNTALGNGPSGGIGFKLDYSSNNTFVSNTANNWNDGYRIESVDKVPASPSWNTFLSNTAYYGSSGFTIHTSSTTLIDNTACYQTISGYYETFGTNGIFIGNTACGAGQYGFILAGSPNSTVKSNIIFDNAVGLELSGSSNNLIYNNVFSNSKNVEKELFLGGEDDSYDAWNITKTPGTNIAGGPFIAGNYWSDYSGRDTDGDGIGDNVGPYTSGGDLSTGDALPLCTSMGCGLELKMRFENDWADYDNNGVVDILDFSSIAFVFDMPSSYWHLSKYGQVVMVVDVATAAYYYGQRSTQASFPGQGQQVGHMDPVWKQFCNFITSLYRTYCTSRI